MEHRNWKDVPQGLKTKYAWYKDGFRLRRGAKPEALITDRYGKHRLYSRESVIEVGKRERDTVPTRGEYDIMRGLIFF